MQGAFYVPSTRFKGPGFGSVCTWAQDECRAKLHMAQPNVPVSKTGHTPPGFASVLRVGGVECCQAVHVVSGEGHML
jgi:hypothetical protein